MKGTAGAPVGWERSSVEAAGRSGACQPPGFDILAPGLGLLVDDGRLDEGERKARETMIAMTPRCARTSVRVGECTR